MMRVRWRPWGTPQLPPPPLPSPPLPARMNGLLNPTSRLTGLMNPTSRLTGPIKPTAILTGLMNPPSRLTGPVNPSSRLTVAHAYPPGPLSSIAPQGIMGEKNSFLNTFLESEPVFKFICRTCKIYFHITPGQAEAASSPLWCSLFELRLVYMCEGNAVWLFYMPYFLS